MKKQKLLYIVPFFPYPPHRGGFIRVNNIIRELSKKFEVHLICLGLPENDLSENSKKIALKFCRTVQIIPHRKSKIKMFWYQLSRFWPYEIALFYNPVMLARVKKMIVNLKPDILLCSRLSGAQFAPVSFSGVKALDQHDLSSYMWRTIIRGSNKWWARLYGKKNIQLVKKYEKSIFSQFDIIISVTDHERKMTSNIVHNKTLITIPNGVDTRYFYPHQHIGTKKYSIVITGAMDQLRNIAAAKFLGEKIFPKLITKFPGAHLYIVGRKPTAEILNLNRFDYITVTGKVEDVRKYIAFAHIVVAPYFIGSGMKHKIPIAMAMAKPIVATKNACQGFELIDRKHVLFAENVESFIESIQELFVNKHLADKLAQNAYEYVLKSFGWDVIVNELENVIKREPHAFT